MLIVSTLPTAWHDVFCVYVQVSALMPLLGDTLTTCPETTAYAHYFSLLPELVLLSSQNLLISAIVLFVHLSISCVPVMCLAHFSSPKEDSSLSYSPVCPQHLALCSITM